MSLYMVPFYVIGFFCVIYFVWFLHEKNWLFGGIVLFGIGASFGPMSIWSAFQMTLTMLFCYGFVCGNSADTMAH